MTGNPDPEMTRLSIELRIMSGYLMRQSLRAIETHFEAHQIPLTHLQHGILRILQHDQHDRPTSKELSRKFGLDPSTLVPVVEALVKRGYVVRERDPNDRRRAPLAITPEGAQLLDSLPMFSPSDPVIQAIQNMGLGKTRELTCLMRELLERMPEGDTMLHEMDAREDLHNVFHRPPAGNTYCAPFANRSGDENHPGEEDDAVEPYLTAES